MDSPEPLAFATGLPRPERGGSTRVQVGCHELVLEGVRGGFALLWSDGREARRYALGLAHDGELQLQLRAPRLPMRIVGREAVTLSPRARLRGYVMAPLVPTITWRGNGTEHVLVELMPRELEAEWDERAGATFRATSSWLVRFPMRSGEPRAVVPIALRNASDGVLSPGDLPLQFADDDLVPLRGCLVVAPRRLVWDGTSWLRTTPPVAAAVPR